MITGMEDAANNYVQGQYDITALHFSVFGSVRVMVGEINYCEGKFGNQSWVAALDMGAHI